MYDLHKFITHTYVYLNYLSSNTLITSISGIKLYEHVIYDYRDKTYGYFITKPLYHIALFMSSDNIVSPRLRIYFPNSIEYRYDIIDKIIFDYHTYEYARHNNCIRLKIDSWISY